MKRPVLKTAFFLIVLPTALIFLLEISIMFLFDQFLSVPKILSLLLDPLLLSMLIVPFFYFTAYKPFNLKIIELEGAMGALQKNIKELADYKYALDEGANIIITDKDGTILHVNDKFCRVSKYSREELIGKNPRVLNSGYHSKEFWKGMYDTTNQGKIWRGEVRNRAKDGTFHWLDTSIVPFMDANGKPYQYLVMRYNITLRKQIESNLQALNAELETRVEERTRESEDRRKYFKALIENSNDAVLLINEQGKVGYQSPSVEKIAGYSVEETYDKNAAEFIHPDDVADFAAVMQELAPKPGNAATRQYRVAHKNGQYIWIEGTISNHLHDENIKAFIVNYRDITGRKLAEEKLAATNRELQTLFNTIDEVLFSVDMVNHRTLQMSAACEKVYGYPPVDFFSNPDFWREVVCPDDLHIIDGNYAHMERGEQFEMQYRIIHKDRGIRWLETMITPTLDRAGKLVRLDGLTRDITDRKQAEEAILKMNVELEERVRERTAELLETNKALEAFSYTVSHDLRAPLRTITGFINIIDTEYAQKFEPELKELFDLIAGGSKRMDAIVVDLLALAKNDKEKLHITEVDMGRLFSKVWNSLTQGKLYHAVMELETLPAVWADSSMMEQVIVNLLGNSIKYSSKKENPYIQVGYYEDSAGVTFFIRDNGAGFDMKNYGRLFSPFQRLHGVSEFEGTGVGLTLVKRIIEKHEGHVWAEAKVNEGAVFYFTLPVINAKETGNVLSGEN